LPSKAFIPLPLLEDWQRVFVFLELFQRMLIESPGVVQCMRFKFVEPLMPTLWRNLQRGDAWTAGSLTSTYSGTGRIVAATYSAP
jgi:hypothetical protein